MVVGRSTAGAVAGVTEAEEVVFVGNRSPSLDTAPRVALRSVGLRRDQTENLPLRIEPRIKRKSISIPPRTAEVKGPRGD